jgi:hypothetical protein
MAERKHKQGENPELNLEEASFLLEPTQIEVGSGYTLQVKHNGMEKPIVNVKTYGEVDLAKVMKEIKKIFPNAQINQMNQPTTVTVVRTKTKKIHKRKKPV